MRPVLWYMWLSYYPNSRPDSSVDSLWTIQPIRDYRAFTPGTDFHVTLGQEACATDGLWSETVMVTIGVEI